ncbi:MAG: FAD-binding oxidoreductase, partial [Anaerohalosphaera sp.]|nr:FAD-binding oxidoreductase [Anaerohalosphaera sp.]
NCWQATPGKVVDLIRTIGVEKGGKVLEDCELIDVEKDGDTYKILIQDHAKRYIEYRADHFINALGPEGEKFARRLGHETGIYSVKHQAFITRRLPMIGVKDTPMPMMIDRRKYKGFTAVYGQQLAETGQIIGCASPAVEPAQTDKTLKTNSRDFLEIASEVFVNWIPELSSVGFQAVWAGYYVEPKMVIDPEHGLFIGLRGQGYMLGQYLAKLYVDKLLGKQTPDYFDRLKLSGDGLLEKSFK